MYENKKNERPSYTVKNFSQLLGVDQSGLSKVMQGNMQFSLKIILRCLKNLEADADLINQVLDEYEKFFGDHKIISKDTYLNIPNWKYWAYLELLKLKNIGLSGQVLTKLNVTNNELAHIKDVLLANGLTSLDRRKSYNNKLVNIESSIDITTDLQKDVLEMAVSALLNVEKEYRYHGSMFFTVDKNSIKDLKQGLVDLQLEFSQKAARKGVPSDVYAFMVTLFPLTQLDIADVE